MRKILLTEYGDEEECLTLQYDVPSLLYLFIIIIFYFFKCNIKEEKILNEGKIKKKEEMEVKGEEIKIRVKACAISGLDWEVRRGRYGEEVVRLPCTPGYEVAGIVERKGDKVSDGRFMEGDEVVGFLPIDNSTHGGLSQLSLHPEHFFGFFLPFLPSLLPLSISLPSSL